MPNLHGFELLRDQTIPELNSRARLYRHARTGARLLSLENAIENKVFGITFRTPPTTSNGIAHIMEHSVLCGSQKYPLKEPFIELVKGSLNTFLNAFTFPDKTCYPVASQNLQDFYNLIEVYMDAVLHPLISEHTLQQEGWHYELDDPAAPLSYKGVVFNEMKGAYSDPDSVLGRWSQSVVFPNNAYGVDSGGDPRVIPELTYAEFRDFHARYYHPSNAFIYFFGDDDPEERLRRMDGYLSGWQALPVDSSIAHQPPLAAPGRAEMSYAGGDDAKAMTTVNWVLAETAADAETTLALSILGHILIGTSAAPLRKALIDSALGEDLAGVGMETELRQVMFSTGLKGIELESAPAVEALILEKLAALAADGIDPQTVLASLNTIEFALRENNTGGFPQGLALMLRALTSWLYDGDPLLLLAFEAPLARIKAAVAAGEPYFERLIQRRLLDNPHRVTLTLHPDPDLSAQLEADERARLEQVRLGLSPQALEAIAADTRLLKQLQETPDSPAALATIPTLQLADLDRQIKTIPTEERAVGATRLFFHDLPTNGIVYLSLGFDLHSLPQELLPYLSLYGRALRQLGTDQQDFVQLSQRIGQTTGGVGASDYTSPRRNTPDGPAWFLLGGKAVTANTPQLLAIFDDLLKRVRLDNRERFKQLVLEEKAGMEAGLIPGGHRVVDARLRAHFHPIDGIEETMGGISYLFFLRKLVEQVDQDWDGVLDKLQEIHRLLINRRASLVNVTVDAAGFAAIEPQLVAFVEALPAHEFVAHQWRPLSLPPVEGLTLASQVNYVGKAVNLYDVGYEYNGAFNVVTNYLQTGYLWERVRVQGGAYGAFTGFDQQSGTFTYLSYRDPNLLATLDVYRQLPDFLRRLELSADELRKAIIGVIGDLDAYQLPDAKGATALRRILLGISDEERQARRDEVLRASTADFHALGEALAAANAANRAGATEVAMDANTLDTPQPHIVVLGGAEAVAAANTAGTLPGGPLQITKVL